MPVKLERIILFYRTGKNDLNSFVLMNQRVVIIQRHNSSKSHFITKLDIDARHIDCNGNKCFHKCPSTLS